jgi:hypothetical protein
MPSFTAATKDLHFVLHDLLAISDSNIPAMPIWTAISPAPFWAKPRNWPKRCWPP